MVVGRLQDLVESGRFREATLVVSRGGEVYYTPNHYDSFVRIK
jgi:hypothetical protein